MPVSFYPCYAGIDGIFWRE